MIKWGILSSGKMAGKFTEDFQFVTGAELVAIGSRSEHSGRSFAEKYNIKKHYSSYEELVQDPSIDVIYISTPHNLHYENTRLCLENGKSVLCEKPIAVNSKQLKKMVSLAKTNNLFLMEALWTYFLPPIIKAQEWINEGAIGTVQLIKADFGFKAPFDPEKRLFNPSLAGGALLDVGIYPLAFALLFANSRVKDIQVECTKASTGVDMTDIYHLNFENGVLADLSCSLESALANDGFIYGSKGYIQLPFFWKSRKAILQRYNEHEPVLFEDKRKSTGYNFEAEEVSKLITSGKKESDIVPQEKSIELLSLMDKIRDNIGLKYPFEE